ncbi:MAG: hypothetical protein ACYS8K_02030 [Planctomycetota bacterium]|jgi:hypothetical protein
MSEQPDSKQEQAKAGRKMASCRVCGSEYAPERQVQRLLKKLGEKAARMDACPPCRRRLYAAELVAAQQNQSKNETGGT